MRAAAGRAERQEEPGGREALRDGDDDNTCCRATAAFPCPFTAFHRRSPLALSFHQGLSLPFSLRVRRFPVAVCCLSVKGRSLTKRVGDQVAAANPQKAGMSLLDARPWANAVANKGKGGGYENVSHYKASDTSLLFLNIDNIHVMRKSLAGMHKLVTSNKKSTPITRAEIDKTDWLTHCGRVLGGAATTVADVVEKKRTIVVHCSDGWDRTAQLCALGELCLDPYYRTVDGFRSAILRSRPVWSNRLP